MVFFWPFLWRQSGVAAAAVVHWFRTAVDQQWNEAEGPQAQNEHDQKGDLRFCFPLFQHFGGDPLVALGAECVHRVEPVNYVAESGTLSDGRGCAGRVAFYVT